MAIFSICLTFLLLTTLLQYTEEQRFNNNNGNFRNVFGRNNQNNRNFRNNGNYYHGQNFGNSGTVSSSTGAGAWAWSNGDSAGSMTKKCKNGECTTCINKKCFPRTFWDVYTRKKCPIAVCEFRQCYGFVDAATDGCPVCDCYDFAAREPCLTTGDCMTGGFCQRNICIYPPLEY